MTEVVKFPASADVGIECVKFTPRRSGALRGFADLRLRRCRLTLIDCAVLMNERSRWVGLPAKAQLDGEKRARIGDNGKVAYTPTVSFDDQDVLRAFSDAAVVAVLAFAPEAFADDVR
jgi:hypothetical protein